MNSLSNAYNVFAANVVQGGLTNRNSAIVNGAINKLSSVFTSIFLPNHKGCKKNIKAALLEMAAIERKVKKRLTTEISIHGVPDKTCLLIAKKTNPLKLARKSFKLSIKWGKVDSCSYVYMLFENRNMVYVGESMTCRRIQTHKLEGKKIFDSAYYFNTSERKVFEEVLIKVYKPKYNKTGKPPLTFE